MSTTARAREPTVFAPPVDLEDIDRARLVRAVFLNAERLGPGRYSVTGGRELHLVDLTMSERQCDCPDHLWRGNQCKHILAARLREGDEAMIRALRLIVPEKL